MTQEFFNWHLNDNIFIQNIRICLTPTTFVIFGSHFQSHNMNLSSWSYSWIKPLASRLVDPIPVSWFSLADFGELNPYSEGATLNKWRPLHWLYFDLPMSPDVSGWNFGLCQVVHALQADEGQRNRVGRLRVREHLGEARDGVIPGGFFYPPPDRLALRPVSVEGVSTGFYTG